MSLGVVNFTPVWGDPKQTLAKIEANVVEAAAQGIDIVAFGEEALIGPTGCDACRAEAAACEFHLELAQTVPGPATDHVADLAREHDLYVIFGLSERDATDPKVLYNTVAVIGPEGLIGTYRKIHLGALPWVTEGIVFRPGNHAAGVPHAVRPDRRADLLRLLVQPGAHADPRVEGRASRRQLLRHVPGRGQARLHGAHHSHARAGEPDLHREREPARRSRAPGLLRAASRRPARRRLPRAQHHRRARVPAVQSRVRGGGRLRGDRERDPQLREAPPLAVDLPDARLARRAVSSTRRVSSPTSSRSSPTPDRPLHPEHVSLRCRRDPSSDTCSGLGGGEHLEQAADRVVEPVDLVARQAREQLLPFAR